MHFTFFDEVIGGNLDNKSTYWKISSSADSKYGTVWTSVFNWVTFFSFGFKGQKDCSSNWKIFKRVVIFSDYFQVCFSWKKKGVVENLFVSQRLGWIITEIFTEKWFINISFHGCYF